MPDGKEQAKSDINPLRILMMPVELKVRQNSCMSIKVKKQVGGP